MTKRVPHTVGGEPITPHTLTSKQIAEFSKAQINLALIHLIGSMGGFPVIDGDPNNPHPANMLVLLETMVAQMVMHITEGNEAAENEIMERFHTNVGSLMALSHVKRNDRPVNPL